MRTYMLRDVASFRFTNAKFGELSNFHDKFPIQVNTTGGPIQLDSTETLYQVDKFRDLPDVQEKLLEAAAKHDNPRRGGKDFARANNHLVSKDWVKGRSVQCMRMAIRLKTNQYWDQMIPVVKATGDLPIVEFSKNDDFWGAKPQPDGTVRGQNALGRLWMEFRMYLEKDPDYCRFTVPSYGTRLLGHEIIDFVRPAKILNAHVVGTDAPGAVYVGRSRKSDPYNKWCNPIPVSEEHPRGEALNAYLDHLRKSPDLIAAARTELAGRDLICWCAPRACHAGVLAHVAAGSPVPETWSVEMQEKNQPAKAEEAPQSSFGF